MKHLSKSKPAILRYILPVLTIVAAAFLLWNLPFVQQFFFEQLCKDIIKEELADDQLSLHYCLSDPALYDLTSTECHLPIFDQEAYEHSADSAVGRLQQLHRIHYNSLNEKQQFVYHLLENSLNNSLAMADFTYYDDYLSPASGLHSELLILLSEYNFSDVQDVEDYLTLLTQVPTYLESLSTYDALRIEHGMYRGDASTKEVIHQCDLMMNPDELNSQTHFLQLSFNKRLQSLVDQGIISENDYNSYVYENDRLVTTVLAPAYEQLGDRLMLSMGNASQSLGLAGYPNGQEYYCQLFYRSTGSSLSINQVKEQLVEEFKKDYNRMSTLLATCSENSLQTYASLPSDSNMPVFESVAMLNDLQQRMSPDFPLPPDITCELKAIDSSMESYLAPAFYLIPPLDNYSENVIYLNPTNFLLETDEAGHPYTRVNSLALLLSLYTTIAHEGFPGHLYQNVSLRSTLPEHLAYSDILRNILPYSGYSEGYATYAEMQSYSYATDYLTQSLPATDASQIATIIEMYQIDQSMRLCLLTLCDIAIHYDNASYEEICEMLTAYGISDESTIENVYTYILNAPCNYPTYYVGYLEILNLKGNAQEYWGEDYSDYRFHEYLILSGPSDFFTLETYLK